MTAITWNSAVNGDWSTKADWNPASVPGSADAVTIGATGASYTVTVSLAEAAKTLTIGSADATLDVGNTLTMGGLLALDAGTLELGGGGVVSGGTIAATGGALVTHGGILDDVTYRGVLTLAGFQQVLNVEGGLTLETAAGGQPGSIDLSGAGQSAILVLDSETLNNATLNFGSGGQDALSSGDTGADTGHTLTLGSGFTIDVSGGTDYLGAFPAFGYQDTGDTLVNAGLINVSAGALNVDYTTFKNTGSVNVDGGVLNLFGTVTTAQLSGIGASNGGALVINGELNNTGKTLDVGTGSELGLISFGTILGGTVQDSGSGLVTHGGTLDGVTYRGVLTLAGFQQVLNVEGGLTLETAAGGQPGSIDLSGAGQSAILVLDSETLNNATLNFGSGGQDALSSGDTGADTGHTLTLGSGFTIDVSGGTDYLGAFPAFGYQDTGDTLVNAGLINVSAGALNVDYTTFKNTGSVNVDGGVLNLFGTVTTAQLSGIGASNGGALVINGELNNTGKTLDVGTGSELGLISFGTILGGTVQDSGSGLVTHGGTLDDVTYRGVLTLAGFQQVLNVEGGLTLETAAGGQPGSIDLSGAGQSAILVLDSETLNNATLNFGSGGQDALSSGDTGADTGHTLTLGSGFTIDVSGGTDYLGAFPAFGYQDTGDTLVNAGLINVSAGALNVDYTTFNNTGSVNVDGGVLNLFGTVTTAQLSGIGASNGGALVINGELNNTGKTLDVGTGSELGLISFATILGGTVHDSGSGLVTQGGTLDGVTYRGVLTLAGFEQFLYIENGITLENASGATPGSIDLSGATGSWIAVLDSETLNNATLNFGSSGGDSLISGTGHGIDSGHTLTLGGGFTIDVSGGGDFLGSTNFIFGAEDTGDTLVNAGLINVSAGSLNIDYGTFKNTGSVNVDGGVLNLFGTVTTAQLSGIGVSNGGDLVINGELNNTGKTLDIGTGSALGLISFGTILGGTVHDSGSGLVMQGGTLDGVTYRGVLTLAGFEQFLYIENGITLENASGATPGSIDLSGATGSWIAVLDSETLNNATLNFGSSGGDSLISGTGHGIDSGHTLTLGGGFTIDVSGGGDFLGSTNFIFGAEDTGDTLVNAGLINVSAGSLNIDYGTFKNTGSVNVDGGVLNLFGTVTTAQLSGIGVSNGGDLVINGELNNTGKTLDVGTGSELGLISFGTILGGTVHDSGSGLVTQGGTLDGVTYRGVLTLAGFEQFLYIENGITLENASGATPGSIDLSGATGSWIAVLDSETLNNATLNFGSSGGDSLISGTGHGIDSGHTLTLGGGFTIDVSGGGDFLGSTNFIFGAEDTGDTLVNAGLINVSAGSLNIDYGTFKNTGSVNVDGGVLNLFGTVTTAQLSGIGVSNGGDLVINGELNNTGKTLDVGTGSELGLISFGTILGGTVHDSGSGLVTQGGTLDGVTYRGVLTLAGFEQFLYIENGITLENASGATPGSIDLSGATGSWIAVLDSETLNNATLNFGSSGGDSLISGTGHGIDSGHTLTLGGGFTIDVSGGGDFLGSTNFIFGAEDTGDTLVNAGLINVSAGSLNIDYGTFKNTGSVNVDGGVLNLFGTVTTAQLSGIGVSNGGDLVINGELNNTGKTLDIGTGSALGLISFGTILGGTVHDSGSGLVMQGGTLDGVTYRGVLTLAGFEQFLYIENGITLENASGATPGSIDLSGATGSWIAVLDSETLNNATLNFGSSGGDSLISGTGHGIDSGHTLTLGGGFTIDVSGGGDFLGSTNFIFGAEDTGDTLVNAGLINVSAGSLNIDYGTFKNTGSVNVDGGVLNIASGTTFTNTGSIGASNGGVLNLQPATFTNLPASTLTGGNYEVDGSSFIELNQNSTISSDNATITLSGIGSTIESFETAVNKEVTLDQSLTTISKSGVLNLLNGRNLTATHNITDNGLLNLGGVIFTAGALTISSTGTASGSGTIVAGIVNNGLIDTTGGLLQLGGTVSGTGGLTIGVGATLELKGATAETVTFSAGTLSAGTQVGGTLKIDTASSYTGTLNNFAPADTIDLANLHIASASISDNTLTANITGGGTQTYTVSGAFNTGNLKVSGDGGSGTDLIAPTALCFCGGTLIQTPRGEVRVEELAAGDTVVAWGGEVRPITWIGAGRVLAARGRRSAATPVIVRKNALADNVPHHDLRVTKGHSFYLDNVLIPVEFLVNHRSILWDDRAQEVALYHIELGSHDVLAANGAPAESYRDDGNRWLFQNANTGWDMPPQEPCAPVLTGGPVVDAAWRRLLDRASSRPGWVLTDDPDLHLLVDGERLDAVSVNAAAYLFRLPARPGSVRVVSRAGAPAELGLARDPRILGVALRRIMLWHGAQLRLIEASDPSLDKGFHVFEEDNGRRWTDGDAWLPATLFEGFDRPTDLVLHVGGATQYPLFGEVVTTVAA